MKTLKISFEMCPLIKSVKGAFDVLPDAEKTAFVEKVLKARFAFKINDEEGKQAKEFLAENFGEKFAEHPGFKGDERLMYSFDKSRRVFRCWFSSFGSLTSFDQFVHFDSCGRGLLFHVECADRQAFTQFIETFTKRMVEWSSRYGQLWAGWK